MAVEPLSDSTRTAKRSVLVASVLAITYRTFDVSIDKLPVAGVVIDFNKGLFAFLLTLLIVYFLVTFCIYYFIDIRNVETTLHQVRESERYTTDFEDRIQRYLHIAKKRADRAVDSGDVHVLFTAPMGNLLRQLNRTSGAEHEHIILATPVRALYELHMRNALSSIVQHPARAGEFDKADKVVNQALWNFLKFERRMAWLAKARLTATNSLYGFRNYILDGALPVALGILALLTMYQVVSLEWIRHIAPAQ